MPEKAARKSLRASKERPPELRASSSRYRLPVSYSALLEPD